MDNMKFLIGVLGFLCCLSLCTGCIAPFKRDLFLGTHAKYNISAAYLEPAQLIRQKGYPSETHMVQTEDGYLLSMNRIPHGVRNNSSQKKGAALLLHGFLGQSIDFLLLKPEKDLAFMLADDGYDVWIGNFRGNTHSKGHIVLTPCDNAFWDYTWHESGIYDLPAMIDFVLNMTNTKKLEYIAHSMGTTAYFVMLSERPEYNEKIAKGHMLAPIAFLKHMKSPIVRVASFLSNVPNVFGQILTAGALLPDSQTFKLIRELVCDVFNFQRELCADAVYVVAGADPQQFDNDLVGAVAYHYPAGYSTRTLNHFAQLFVSGEFRQYDFGPARNIEHYGSATPPAYNLKNVTAPTILYVGPNDFLGNVDDARKLSKYLPSLEEFYLVKFNKFNHFDFLFATDAKTLVYDEIMKRMTKA